MSGVYIHIPFCHHKCTYCDFYFSVSTKSLDAVISAILKEIENRRHYLSTPKLNTIYLGGGTPSILDLSVLERIFYQMAKYFEWDKDTEITIECNPEDINKRYLMGLKKIGINRISLGVQSLNDKVLKWMGRNHGAAQSIESIRLIQKSGIENFSVDLIYGVPDYDLKSLEKDIEYLLQLAPIPHISAYQLTVEPKTQLHYLVKRKCINLKEEEELAEEFLMIQEKLQNRGYDHYEISNYAQKGFISKHNLAYWLQKPYLGIGPSAHSYNGYERQWNVCNNYLYAQYVQNNKKYYDSETLTVHQRYNEYVYTRLRTKYGCHLDEIQQYFGEYYVRYFLKVYDSVAEYFKVYKDLRTYVLDPHKGFLLADKLASEFFVISM